MIASLLPKKPAHKSSFFFPSTGKPVLDRHLSCHGFGNEAKLSFACWEFISTFLALWSTLRLAKDLSFAVMGFASILFPLHLFRWTGTIKWV